MMTDISRVEKTFYKHAKAINARNAEPGSISLWLFANCWCRNHRTQGVIPREKALELGSEAEIQALVDARLWRLVGDDYEFRDWRDWNPDMVRKTPTSSAIYIVQRKLPNHPKATQDRLADEVLKLIEEGVPRKAIEAGLDKWAIRKDATFSWLPYFVSDAIRDEGESLSAAIREARKTWNMAPLAKFGLEWVAPDLPPRIPVKRVREFMQSQKSAWLDMIEADIERESTERRTS